MARRMLASCFALAVLTIAAPLEAWAEDGIPPATEFAQIVSLEEGAQAGVVQLKPKGGYFGDDVAVDLTGALIGGHPVTITVRLEFLGKQKSGEPWPLSKALAMEQAIESRIGPLKASDGTPVTVDLDVRVRPGLDAKSGGTPGYHQIVLDDRPNAFAQGGFPNTVSADPIGPNGEHSGDWGANEMPKIWAHEVGHLLGLPDRYLGLEPDCVVGDKRFPLPKAPKGASETELNAWLKELQQLCEIDQKYGKGGQVEPGIPPGHEDDIMADTSPVDKGITTFLPADVDDFVARAGVRLKAQPGDILVNKDATDQNLAVGAGLDMFAPKDETVHKDGLFGYCIDLHEHIPFTGGFDVLTTGAVNGLTNFGALRAVLAEIGRRQAAGAGPEGPPGAIFAVWAVSDALDPAFTEGEEILAAAGVTFDQTQFSLTPHPEDPNAGPTTAAVTTSAVLPTIPTDTSPLPERLRTTNLPHPRLRHAGLAARRVRPGKRRRVQLLTIVEGSDALVTVSVVRGKAGKSARKRKPMRSVKVALPVGPGITTVRLPLRRPGRYRLVIKGDVRKTLKLRVGRRR